MVASEYFIYEHSKRHNEKLITVLQKFNKAYITLI